MSKHDGLTDKYPIPERPPPTGVTSIPNDASFSPLSEGIQYAFHPTSQPTVKVTKRVTFDASHYLHIEKWSKEKNLEVFHKCSQFKPEDEVEEPHGHTYQLEVTVEGVPNADTGFVIDFKELKKIIQEKVLGQMDHRLLNNIPYFKGKTTTAENIVQFMWEELYEAIYAVNRRLRLLKLYETPDSYVEFSDNHVS